MGLLLLYDAQQIKAGLGNGVKKPAKSNIYLDVKLKSLADFDTAIDGNIDAEACVVSYGILPTHARSALDAACARIDMPNPLYLDVSSCDPTDAFKAIEGLDPVAVLVADDVAAALLSQAYRSEVVPDTYGRLFGRSYVAFTSFEADLAEERTKQRDWALLKTLRSSSAASSAM